MVCALFQKLNVLHKEFTESVKNEEKYKCPNRIMGKIFYWNSRKTSGTENVGSWVGCGECWGSSEGDSRLSHVAGLGHTS